MKQSHWTITIAQVRGIPIRLHLTFLLFVGLLVSQEAGSLAGAVHELLFVLALFFCIVLHELGHALVAARFKIKTRDIVLYPFGGVASITAAPAPAPELAIAIAGPLVNVAIALLLTPFFSWQNLLTHPTLVEQLLSINLFLALFNMVPALPMDGGRVLRALLALGEVRNATLIASRISQSLSVVCAVVALYCDRMDLLLVSMVVFLGAAQEVFHAQTRLAVQGRTVLDAMIEASRLESFGHGTTLSLALTGALKSLQEFFPVRYGTQLLGVVDKQDLLEFAARGEADAYISEVITKDYPVVGPNDDLAKVLERPEAGEHEYFVVLEGGEFRGMLFKDKVIEFLLVDDLRRRITESPHLDEYPPV